MRPRVGAKLYTYPAQKTMETLPANHPKAKEKVTKLLKRFILIAESII